VKGWCGVKTPKRYAACSSCGRPTQSRVRTCRPCALGGLAAVEGVACHDAEWLARREQAVLAHQARVLADLDRLEPGQRGTARRSGRTKGGAT
jgi:hypothetical protein